MFVVTRINASPGGCAWPLGHETHDKFGIIKVFEGGAVYVGSSGVLEPAFLATSRFLWPDWTRRHFTDLRCFDGSCLFGELVILESASGDCDAWIHRVLPLVGRRDAPSSLSYEDESRIGAAQLGPSVATPPLPVLKDVVSLSHEQS